jgi:ABC-type polysaccharide/polyol phosphate export permease
MCADCWGVKDAARARRWLRQPRRQPLIGFDWEDPLDLLWAFGAVVLLLLIGVYVLTQWI